MLRLSFGVISVKKPLSSYVLKKRFFDSCYVTVRISLIIAVIAKRAVIACWEEPRDTKKHVLIMAHTEIHLALSSLSRKISYCDLISSVIRTVRLVTRTESWV